MKSKKDEQIWYHKSMLMVSSILRFNLADVNAMKYTDSFHIPFFSSETHSQHVIGEKRVNTILSKHIFHAFFCSHRTTTFAHFAKLLSTWKLFIILKSHFCLCTRSFACSFATEIVIDVYLIQELNVYLFNIVHITLITWHTTADDILQWWDWCFIMLYYHYRLLGLSRIV